MIGQQALRFGRIPLVEKQFEESFTAQPIGGRHMLPDTSRLHALPGLILVAVGTELRQLAADFSQGVITLGNRVRGFGDGVVFVAQVREQCRALLIRFG